MADTQNQQDTEALSRAVECLKDGGVVATPTDTLFGLAADVFNTAAIDRVFAVKGRPENLALPALVNGWEQLALVAKEVPPQTKRLTERFWPGGLTLVVPKADAVPDRLTAGGPTVAVRMPDHPAPMALIDGLGGPVTGTSANISGAPDLASLDDLAAQIGEQVDYILDFGPPPQGTQSTVVDITTDTPKLLREGAIPFASVIEVWEAAST